jgi:hypothetical protein
MNLKNIYEQISLDFYGIKELKDGLTFEVLREKYVWILKAFIKNAIIGLTPDKKIKWYNGTWKSGIWLDGEWLKGTWEKGVWDNGKWLSGLWMNGQWKNGSWLGGKWIKGIKQK